MSTFNDDLGYDDANPPEESSNRTFLFAAGGLGLLVLLALLCLGAYVLFNLNSSQTAEQTAVAQALTATSGVTATLPPTSTPVVAQVSVTVSPTANPATATVGAAFTQIAVSTQTFIPTSTALPNSGIGDEVGIPGMFLASLALVVVIFLVRRLRASPTR